MMLFKKLTTKKPPLSDLHMNTPKIDEEDQVTNLIDTKKAETASSVGTINTVIPLEKLNIMDIPEVIVTGETIQGQNMDSGNRASTSKSPLTKSHTTPSTVRDNHSSFKSGDSLNSSKRLGKFKFLYIIIGISLAFEFIFNLGVCITSVYFYEFF